MEQYAVIGLGAFGHAVAVTLAESKKQVLVIDNDEDKVRRIADVVTHAVVLDATDQKALQEVGVKGLDAAVVGIGSLEPNIMVTLNLIQIGVPKVVAKAGSKHHGMILERLGATRIVYPEQDMGRRLAQSLATPTIFDHIQLSEEYSIEEILPPPAFIGKSLQELDIRAQFGINVVGLRHDHKGRTDLGYREINIAPQADVVIQAGDTLFLIGSNRNIEAFSKEQGKLRGKRG